MVVAAKLPVLNSGEFKLWKMMIEQYFLMMDYALWEVIVNGNSPPPKRTVDGVEQTYPPTTIKENFARKNELKARGTLLMALPNEYQLKFNTYKCANTLMEAIEKRFGGNKESKKTQKTLLKQQYENFNGSSSEGLDQTYDRLPKLISQLEILDNEDLQQIDADDLEEMDLKWQMAMLTIRARRFLNKTRRKISANGSETIGFNKSKVECYNLETTKAKALVSQDGLGYDWSDQAKEGPINFALKGYTSSGSSSSSSSDSESQLNVGAYKVGLESVEARLEVYKKNEVVFEEDKKILKLDIKLRDNALIELRKKFEKAKKERDDLKLTLEKFENSSKKLSKLLDSQISDNFKTGLGFDSQGCDSQVFDSQVFDSQVNDKYKTSEGYHAVPPPYTGNFMPPTSNLVLADEDEYVVGESVTSVPDVATSEVNESKPKLISKPLIEDYISDSEDENETESKSKQRKPSFAKVEFVKSNEHVKSSRESVKKVENNKQAKYPRKNSQSPRGN
ncbi:hypothetical protein Tco_1377152 [Tanacetum coccineum]